MIVMKTEHYFVIIIDANYYVKTQNNKTESLRYAKYFEYYWQAEAFIKQNNLKNTKIAELSMSTSFISHKNKDKPMTQKQRGLIDKLLEERSRMITHTKEPFPKGIDTVQKASEWIQKTIDELNEVYYRDEVDKAHLWW